MGYKPLKVGIAPKGAKPRSIGLWLHAAYNSDGAKVGFFIRFMRVWIQIQWGEI